MSPIRMIAIDLDDTLLHDDISVSSYTKDTLRRVMEKGIPVVIATGRMFQAARPWGKEIGLGDVPMICYTGALVGMCRSGRILEHVTMDLELARDILETGRTHGWYMHTYIDDEVYMPFRDERTDIYEKQCGITAHIAGEKFWKPSPTKITDISSPFVSMVTDSTVLTFDFFIFLFPQKAVKSCLPTR